MGFNSGFKGLKDQHMQGTQRQHPQVFILYTEITTKYTVFLRQAA